MNTKNDLLRIGNIPKKAEYKFFLSKLPGIGYDLSIDISNKFTYLYNLMCGSIYYQVCFNMCSFYIWLYNKFI
jgi:hypothetical protein